MATRKYSSNKLTEEQKKKARAKSAKAKKETSKMGLLKYSKKK
jgi:hypothetical protein